MDEIMDLLRAIPFLSENTLFNLMTEIIDNVEFISMGIWLTCIVLVLASYVFSGYTLMFIGRKAGLDNDWMPFLPIVRTLYRLRILGESWWKMFFLEYCWVYALIFAALLYMILGYQGLTFAAVIIMAYFITAYAYKLIFTFKYYAAFDFNPYLALVIITPQAFVVTVVIDCILAYNNKYAFYGLDDSTPRQTYPGRDPELNTMPTHTMAQPQNKRGFRGGSMTGVAGIYLNQRFEFRNEEEIIFGRDPFLAHIIFDFLDENISRKHCGVVFDAARDSYLVTDYSTNGTYLENGVRITANIPLLVKRGATIALGNNENQFKLN